MNDNKIDYQIFSIVIKSEKTMLSKGFLTSFVFSFLLSFLVITPCIADYNYDVGNITLWHSENAYCDPSTYTTRTNKGALEGFVAVYHIQGDKDTEGYIGYTDSQQAIYVSFRGSSDIQNWITNIQATTTNYPLCSDCNVHKGFYNAEQSVIHDVIEQVQKLTGTFPSYKVYVTGHSLGAALATLTALDLLNAGISNIALYNFGSPRVGDDNFAAWASSRLGDRNRVTHHKDIVPHCPMHERFTHISGEWYEADDTIHVNACEGYEDPNCSYQWHITSVDDHLWYMGVVLGGDGCSALGL